MAHHHHHAEDAQVYYLDQLCTIGLCAALSGAGIMMWHQDLLKYILATQFHMLVLAGSVGLLILVTIRAAALWQATGKPAAEHQHHHHDHDHPHGHEHHHHAGPCDHDHKDGHCDHDHGPAPVQANEKPRTEACCAAGNHDHDHDHGWSPWRYMVLLIPFVLYVCGLPNQGFSADRWVDRLAAEVPEDTGTVQMAGKGDDVLALDFTELRSAAFLPSQRTFYEGKTGKLLGQFLPGSTPTTCSLIRVKMVCCAADATALNVVIIAPAPLEGFKPLDWVEVEGQIQFRKRRDRDEYIPVLQILAPDKIKATSAPSNPYL